MQQRLLGRRKKAKTPALSLEQLSEKLETQIKDAEAKINEQIKQLRPIAKRSKKLRKGTAAHTQNQARAKQIIQRKRILEQNADNLRKRLFNVEQQILTRDSALIAQEQVQAMQQARKAMKAQVNKLDPVDVEEMQDDMEDYKAQLGEVQDTLGYNSQFNDIHIGDEELMLELGEGFDELDVEEGDEIDDELEMAMLEEELLPAAPKTKVKNRKKVENNNDKNVELEPELQSRAF